MFYSDVILAKRGPLARVWLAAHWERKLSKTQLLQTNIEKSVSAIMGQEVVPMALRLSGQLLLGVVRIYSRKAKYLLDDCNEALLKIKMAFRSGAVDMTSDQLTVSRNAITLQNTRTDFSITMIDPALQDWNPTFGSAAGAPGATPSKSASKKTKATPNSASHTARITDITLPQVNYDDNWDLHSTQDGIQSQDFDPDGGLDLGLDLFDNEEPEARQPQRRDDQGRPVDSNGDPITEGAEDDSMSIGVGRDASHIERGASEIIGDITSRSLGGFEGQNDMFGEMEFGGDMPDFGDFMNDAPRPNAGGIDDTPSGDSIAQALADVTPRTANQIRDAALRREQEKAAKGGKAHKVVVDSVTELPETQAGARSQSQQSSAALRRPVDDIIMEQSYLPRSKPYLHLLAIRTDPTAHFLPFVDLGKEKIYTGPAGLAPELSDLFTLELSSLRRRRAADGDVGRTPKRQRLDVEDLESEVGRRDERAGEGGNMDLDWGLDPSNTGLGEGLYDDMNMEQGGDMPNFELDMGGDEDGPRRSMRKSGVEEEEVTGRLIPLSRMSTPEGDGDVLSTVDTGAFTPSLTNPLGIFDARHADAQEKAPSATAATETGTQGWSKNTVRAQKIIRSQITAAREGDADADAEDATISFKEVASGASARAKAGFFFELLVLGTKNCIKLQQEEPFGDIKVGAKEGLWGGETPAASRSTRRGGRINGSIQG